MFVLEYWALPKSNFTEKGQQEGGTAKQSKVIDYLYSWLNGYPTLLSFRSGVASFQHPCYVRVMHEIGSKSE